MRGAGEKVLEVAMVDIDSAVGRFAGSCHTQYAAESTSADSGPSFLFTEGCFPFFERRGLLDAAGKFKQNLGKI